MNNDYEIKGCTTVIFLKRKNGAVLETLIDTSDLPMLLRLDLNWRANWYKNSQSFYAIANHKRPDGKWTASSLHRVITSPTEDQVVDHIKAGNTLDNRRSNLRLASRSENATNRKGATSLNKLGVRGVIFHKATGKFRARVRIMGKALYDEYFSDLKEAEQAVKLARAKYMPFSAEAREGHFNF